MRSNPARPLHSDTLATVRVALRADPARFDTATIARATAALTAAVGSEPAEAPARALSQADVARLLGCSRWSIRRLVAAGRLRPRKLLSGLTRFDRHEVEALISSSHVQ